MLAIDRSLYQILIKLGSIFKLGPDGLYFPGTPQVYLKPFLPHTAGTPQSPVIVIYGIFGALDITPFRDDRIADATHSAKSTIHFPVQDKRVVIVDDVLYTGRSCRAAIDAILAIGRPQCMQLAVLVDRGHRELPIRPDYIGKNVPTAQSETVRVSVREIDGTDCVVIYQNTDAEMRKE